MAEKKVEWRTPIARMMFLQECNKTLEKCPHEEPLPKKITYFNNPRKHKKVNMYDVAFNPPPGYNQRMHRDDRQQLSIIRENIFQQEKDKRVPVLTSLQHARPWAKRLDPHDTTYFLTVGVGAFYSRTGINIAPELEKQFAQNI